MEQRIRSTSDLTLCLRDRLPRLPDDIVGDLAAACNQCLAHPHQGRDRTRLDARRQRWNASCAV